MTRRILVFSVVLGIVVGLGWTSVAAKGRCRAVLEGRVVCEGDFDGVGGRGAFAIPDRRCHREGRQCNREGGQCETLFRDVECFANGTDGLPTSTVTVGLGCFCGGGSLSTVRDDPISADDFLRLLQTLEASDADAQTCEAPPELTAKPAIAEVPAK